MKLGLIKRISKEDMAKKGEVPKWIDPLLDSLNTFIERVTQALNGNLVFEDNFLSKISRQSMTSGTAYTINPALEGRSQTAVYGVLLIDTNGEEVDKFVWSRLASGAISVTVTFTDTTATATCVLLILSR